MRSSTKLFLAMLCVGMVATSTTASDACVNGIRRENPRISMLNKAERLLSAGYNQRAVVLVERSRLTGRLKQRGDAIVAKAIVRTNGAVAIAGKTVNNRKARMKRVQRAILTLRTRWKHAPSHPGKMTDLAEARSYVAAQRSVARRTLEALATKNLITTAFGYRALAKLRALEGDAKGRAAALKRCRTMAQRKQVCRAPQAAKVPTKRSPTKSPVS